LVFCSGLGVYFYMARRRRLRNGEARADYEFELLDDEEAEGLNSGEKGAAGRKGRTGRGTRGGELYDAFAGGSDDDEEDEYRDRAYDQIMGGTGESREEIGEKSKRIMRRSDDDDGSDESDQHVVGDDEDDDEEDAPLRGTGA
jgi:kexin